MQGTQRVNDWGKKLVQREGQKKWRSFYTANQRGTCWTTGRARPGDVAMVMVVGTGYARIAAGYVVAGYARILPCKVPCITAGNHYIIAREGTVV